MPGSFRADLTNVMFLGEFSDCGAPASLRWNRFTCPTTEEGSVSSTAQRRVTAALLACGAFAGPLFLAVVGLQDLTRAGVDPRRQPLSLLSLGDVGWVQIANFVTGGLLNLAFAVGLRRARLDGHRGLAGPVLIGAYGVGLLTAGVFVTDPARGFPPGVAAPARPSWHQTGHTIGAILAFGALIAACGVFARRFAASGERRCAMFCAVTGVALVALVLSTSVEAAESLLLHAAAVVGWTWASALAAGLWKTYLSGPRQRMAR
jgi:hypothetical protein